jgi:hypothetical protein
MYSGFYQGHPSFTRSIQLSKVSFQLSKASFQLTTVSFQLSKVSFQLSKASFQLTTVSFQLSKVSFQLSKNELPALQNKPFSDLTALQNKLLEKKDGSLEADLIILK